MSLRWMISRTVGARRAADNQELAGAVHLGAPLDGADPLAAEIELLRERLHDADSRANRRPVSTIRRTA